MKQLTILFIGLIAFSSCKKELVDTSINEIEDVTGLESFRTTISSGVTMAFFHASWCSICEEQRPNVEAASENDQVSFAKFVEIEYDDHKDIFDEFKVKGFPHVLIFQDGVEKEKLAGKGHSEQKLVDLLLNYK